MRVEVPERGEHSAPGRASHPGRAVPPSGTAAALHRRKPALHGSREQRTAREQAEALPRPRRKRRAGRAGERAARAAAGEGEQGQLEDFSGQRNSPRSRRRVSSWHKGSTERSKTPLSVIRNVLNQ